VVYMDNKYSKIEKKKNKIKYIYIKIS